MGLLPDLAVRRREPEVMDDPGLDPVRHRLALDALERVNRLSLTAGRAWRVVETLARAGVTPVRVLDVACGGGDLLAEIDRRARRRGMDVQLVGCDASPVALARAEERVGRGGRVSFAEVDVLTGSLPGRHDLVCCALFLHHLDTADALKLLRAMAGATDHALLVQDLSRSRLGHALAWVALRVLTASDVARTDGPLSVRAAFTPAEARGLAAAAGLEAADIRACWPERFVLRWSRA